VAQRLLPEARGQEAAAAHLQLQTGEMGAKPI